MQARGVRLLQHYSPGKALGPLLANLALASELIAQLAPLPSPPRARGIFLSFEVSQTLSGSR